MADDFGFSEGLAKRQAQDDAKFQRAEEARQLEALPLGGLEHAYKTEKTSGALSPQKESLYKALLQQRTNDWLAATDGMEAADLIRDSMVGVDEGRVSKKFFNTVVKSVAAERAKARLEKGVFQIVKDVGGKVLSDPIGIVGDLATTLYEGGKDLAGSAFQASGAAGSDYEDRLKGGAKTAAMLETGARQSVGQLARAAQVVTPGDSMAEQVAVSSLRNMFNFRDGSVQGVFKDLAGPVTGTQEASSSVVPRVAQANSALKSGDVDTWWNIAVEDLRGEVESGRVEGSLAKTIGLNRAELETSGVTLDDTDYAEIQSGAQAASELLESAIPLEIGFSLAASGAKAGLRRGTTALARRTGTEGFLRRLEKIAGPVEVPSLAKKLETSTDEAARLAADAERYNTAVQRARKAAGGASVEFGNWLRQQTIRQGAAPAALAAGTALANGGDMEAALYAGLGGVLVGRFITSAPARAGVATGFERLGKGLARELPTPLENARRALIDFRAQYKPFQATAAGAAAGTFGALPWVLGAQSDEEAAGALVSGAAFGAGGAASQRMLAWGGDQLLRAGVNAQKAPDLGGDVRPETPAALNESSVADTANAAAFVQLSNAGAQFADALRKDAQRGGASSYVFTRDNAQAAITDLVKPEYASAFVLGDAQGLTIPAEAAKSGRPTAVSVLGSQSGGHEVTHALVQAGLANPDTRPLWQNALKTAAFTLGASYDPATNKVTRTSEPLERLRDHYTGLMPAGTPRVSADYALHENLAEHGSVLLSGAPAGKLGGSRNVSAAVTDALLALGARLAGKKAGVAESGVATSDALPYTPSFWLLRNLGDVLRASALEKSPDVPDASIEAEAEAVGERVPVRPPVEATPTTFKVPGVLNPIPLDLASDPQSPYGQTTTPAPPDGLQETQGQEALQVTTPASPATTPAGAVRGAEVQAARTLFNAPLTPEETALVERVQPDEAKRPTTTKVISHLKGLAGQRVGIPVVEMNYKDSDTGVVRSKRVAPYSYDVSSGGKVTVIAADLDRITHNAKLLFDWAAQQGTPARFGYSGLSDPQFITDVQTYLRNQAEGRRGSGEPLMVGGNPSTASGEPVAKLSRDKELFLSTIMGQAIPSALTPRSAAAIARIKATAGASGVTPLDAGQGAVEPNSLRDALRKEGAPIGRIGEDPDPTRRQANPEGRNSVVMRLSLPNIESFEPTGQALSQPNTQAIEASFMPSARLEDFQTNDSVEEVLGKDGWAIFTAENPDAKPLSAEENARRNAQLEDDLKSQNLSYIPVEGSYGQPENSFVVLDPNLTIDKAAELARKYGQESVLTRHGLVYQDGSIVPAKGIQTFDTAPEDFFTKSGDAIFSADIDFDTRIDPESVEGQSLRAEEALRLGVSATPAYMPAKGLRSERVKGPEVQFKRRAKKGSLGGVVDVVHFSSKNLDEINPVESFGKGAATPIDRTGEPKAFFYVDGTTYEAPIASRPNVYTATIDGNALYNYNEDALGVQNIVNRELRDQRIREAGFAGYYVETPGFDAVAIFDPVKVKSTLRQEVMTPRQMKSLGLSKQESQTSAEALRDEVVRSPEYSRARSRIAKRVGSETNGAFFDEMDAWVDAKVAERKAAAPAYMPARKDALGLYSQLEKTLEAIPEKASRQQIEAALRDGVKEKGVLKERPVKQEELADVKDQNGVSFADWMKANPEASKAEMLEFVKASDVRVAERVVGDADMGVVESWWNDEGGAGEETPWSDLSTSEQQEAARRYEDEVGRYSETDPTTQYEDYQLPGGENYREVVLTLPLQAPKGFTIDDLTVLSPEESYRPDIFWNIKGPDNTYNIRKSEYPTKEQALDYVEATKQPKYSANNYQSSHFKDIPNYLAHARYNERTVDVDVAPVVAKLVESSGVKSEASLASGSPEAAVRKGTLTEAEAVQVSKAKGWRNKFNPTGDKGSKVFFVEEIQSDLHQEGRKKGYAGPAPTISRVDRVTPGSNEWYVTYSDGVVATTFADTEAGAREAVAPFSRKGKAGVADAPFKKSWPELVFKTLLNKAARSNSDFIAWTTGEQQAERYDLSKTLSSVRIGPDPAFDSAQGRFYTVMGWSDGRRIINQTAIAEDKLSDYVGKDLAEKAVRDGAIDADQDYSGLDLKVGGEGMKGFYDKILPSLVDKYAKKWGVKVEDLTLPSGNPERNAYRAERGLDPLEQDAPAKVHALRITPEMRQDILENGQPRYMPTRLPSGVVFEPFGREGSGDFIARRDGKEIGYASVSEADPERPYLSNIRINEDQQGLGIGRAFYDFIESQLGKPLRPSPLYVSDAAKRVWTSKAKTDQPLRDEVVKINK